MSDRTRRHNQHHRRNPQISQSASHNQNHNPNRSIYNGPQVDAYSTSNYRHPSTTTTNTDPSSIAPSQTSRECGMSIFYSYLVAIVSSFLVVLGIYLSLTKFNIRFLYISLLGFSIEAVGACIYCISNIRSSQLEKRKQRISSNEFILRNGQSNIENNQRGQQQMTRITHILNDRTLNPNSSDTDTVHNQNTPSAIINDSEARRNDILAEPLPSRPTDLNDNLVPSTSGGNTDNGHGIERDPIITLSNQDQHPKENQAGLETACSSTRSSSIDQLPNRSRCQQSPDNSSGDFLSSTGLLENQHNSLPLVHQEENNNNSDQAVIVTSDNFEGEQNVSTQLSINMVSQFNSQLGDKNTLINTKPEDENDGLNFSTTDNGVPSAPAFAESDSSSEIVSGACRPEAAQSQNEFARSNEDSDLINLQHSGGLVTSEPVEPQVVKRKQPQSGHQRAANLRRTLVMGLSGEEEMIEIDEEDLDNMSILPPSYESIATNSRPNDS